MIVTPVVAHAEVDLQAVEFFIRTWFQFVPAGSLLELRPFSGGRPRDQQWYSEPGAAVGHVFEAGRAGQDVYLGALPRASRGGGASAVGRLAWVYSDIDYGAVGHASPAAWATREEALAAVRGLAVEPTVLVDTGGGLHAWYALETTGLGGAAGGGPEVGLWTEAMRRVCQAVRGDRNGLDRARILRVAGTQNWKIQPPRPVRRIGGSARAVALEALLQLPEVVEPVVEAGGNGDDAGGASTGASGGGSGSSRPFDQANDIPVADVLRWLGVKLVTRSGNLVCACPVHRGKNVGQMVVGGKANVAHCFGDCQRTFSAVDLVMRVEGVGAKEAVDRLGVRFGFEGFGLRAGARVYDIATGGVVEGAVSGGGAGAGGASTSGDPRRLLVRGDSVELGARIVETLRARGPLTYDEGAFYQYDGSLGLWKALDPVAVDAIAASFAGVGVLGAEGRVMALKLSDNAIHGAVRQAMVAVASGPHVTFEKELTGVAFTNGFVVVERGEIVLREHCPQHCARTGFPFPYEKDASTPEFDEFLDSVFHNRSEDDRAACKALLQQFVGACLVGDATKYQQCLVLFGEGSNGKSQFLEIVESIFPTGSVASLSPQKWHERFSLAALQGARINIVDELPGTTVSESNEVFKQVVTARIPMLVERKYKDGFTFLPRAGHVFSANELPAVTDHSKGFWRRLIVLPFSVTFEGEKVRQNEGARILAAERAGIVVWALRGAQQAQLRGGYVIPDSAHAMKEVWAQQADSVWSFVLEACLAGLAHSTPASDLYVAYRNWAQATGHKPVSSTKFGLRLKSQKVGWSVDGHKRIHYQLRVVRTETDTSGSRWRS